MISFKNPSPSRSLKEIFEGWFRLQLTFHKLIKNFDS